MNNRLKKANIISNLESSMNGFSYVYVYGQNKISTSELYSIRLAAKCADINMKFIKNTLAKRVLNDDRLDDIFKQGNIMFFGFGDPLAAAQILSKYEKEYKDKFLAKAGLIDNNIYDKSVINQMSAVGSIDGLWAMFLGVLKAPMNKFARALGLIAEKMEGK